MSDKTTKLNNTVDDFFNTPTPKPFVSQEIIPQKQDVEITNNHKVEKLKKQDDVKNTISITKSTKIIPETKFNTTSGLIKKTIHLREEQLEWFEETFLKFRRKNKKAKEYNFTLFLFDELTKANLKL
jgi:tRNA isopentenyl-2-thiomethyl-A-37 hydroxylase MiaE